MVEVEVAGGGIMVENMVQKVGTVMVSETFLLCACVYDEQWTRFTYEGNRISKSYAFLHFFLALLLISRH